MQLIGQRVSLDVEPHIINLTPSGVYVTCGNATFWHIEASRIQHATFIPKFTWFGALPNAGHLLITTNDGDSYSQPTHFFNLSEISILINEINRLALR